METSPQRLFEFNGLSEDQRALVEWAADLFDRAELELPSIRFDSYDLMDPCRGRAGMAVHSGKTAEIRLCGGVIGPTSNWVVLHELAHVWAEHALDPGKRRAFLEVRGHAAWRSGEWHERGAENAAEVLLWGLIDRPVVPGHIEQNSCSELLTAYVTLVDRPPLHGFTDACE